MQNEGYTQLFNIRGDLQIVVSVGKEWQGI